MRGYCLCIIVAMEDKDSPPFGSPLIAVLEEAALRKGLNKRELADKLGVTYGYLIQLKNGVRDTKNISDEFADRCASFLGVSRIKLLLRSGRVRLSDFYDFEDEEEYKLEVWKALDFIKADKEWGVLFPYTLLEADADLTVQEFVVRLYETATGRVLLKGKNSFGELSKGPQPFWP